MRFMFGTVYVNGKWYLGVHDYDKNGVHFVRPEVEYESQTAAYEAFKRVLKDNA